MNAMREQCWRQIMPALCAILVLIASPAFAENIDPDNNGSQYVWSENAGWLNAEPNGEGGPGIEVTDTELSGYLWGENFGWVSVSCVNTGSCGTVDFGVTNDGAGNLAGYAWAENVGWISFSCENRNSCGTSNYGVIIDPDTGFFDGRAWAENIGWISFGPVGDSLFGIVTSWNAVADDGDGIALLIDGTFVGGTFSDQSGVFSNDFTDQHLGGTSFGTIVARADLDLTVTDAANPDGLSIAASGGGVGTGDLNVCNTVVQFTDGDAAVVTCSSLSIQVLVGPIEVLLGSGEEILVTIPDGATVTITETAPDEFEIENTSPAGTDPIVAEVGGVPTAVNPGETVPVSGNPPLSCPACDLTGDNVVDFNDLSAVFPCMGQTAPLSPPCDVADVNGDGIINFNDVSLIVSNFT